MFFLVCNVGSTSLKFKLFHMPSEEIFTEAKISEIRILGYEVLDENEEVLFDMPDVEILGDKIPDALAALNQSRPHAVEFTQEDGFAVLTLADNTDTYKIQIDFKEIFSE